MQKNPVVVKSGIIFCYTSFVMLPFQTSVVARIPYFKSTTQIRVEVVLEKYKKSNGLL